MSTSTPASKNAPHVRLVRVTGQAQKYAAYSMKGVQELLGYCGRDGVITHPVGDTASGTPTKIILVQDPRISRQGLQRSMEVVNKLTVRDDLRHDPDAPKKPDPRWKEINRKEVGLYATPVEAVGGPNWETAGYFCVVYEITEKLDGADEAPEIRVRLAEGKPCRMTGEGYKAFQSLFHTYLQYAREHDEGKHVERSLRCFPKLLDAKNAAAFSMNFDPSKPLTESRKKRDTSEVPVLAATGQTPKRKKRLASAKD